MLIISKHEVVGEVNCTGPKNRTMWFIRIMGKKELSFSQTCYFIIDLLLFKGDWVLFLFLGDDLLRSYLAHLLC